jgi:hypothetical protein
VSIHWLFPSFILFTMYELHLCQKKGVNGNKMKSQAGADVQLGKGEQGAAAARGWAGHLHGSVDIFCQPQPAQRLCPSPGVVVGIWVGFLETVFPD